MLPTARLRATILHYLFCWVWTWQADGITVYLIIRNKFKDAHPTNLQEINFINLNKYSCRTPFFYRRHEFLGVAETVFVKAKEIRVLQEKVCYNEWKGLYCVPIVSSIAIITAMSSLVVRLSVRLHYTVALLLLSQQQTVGSSSSPAGLYQNA